MDLPRTSLPGFGQPLKTNLPLIDSEGKRRRFPHAICDTCNGVGISLRERRMLELINQITDKPEWDRKVFDEEIVSKWRSEACVWRAELREDYLSAAMFDYCVQELRDKATYFQASHMVSVWDSDRAIVKSDTVVTPTLASSLRQNVQALEDVPDQWKDWHPGSNQQVLDLLHPSLFPLIYGKSRALPHGTVPLDDCARFSGEGAIVDPELDGTRETLGTLPEWGSFQWLPSNISLDQGGQPRIVSYINNLHPKVHRPLYGTLERFVAAAIPLWNECLTWSESRLRIEVPGLGNEALTTPDGVTFTPAEDDVYSDTEIRPYTWEEAKEIDFIRDENYWEWCRANRIVIPTEPGPFCSRQQWEERADHRRVDLQKQFAESGLQVIFKLANIHLTPEQPQYDGGSWHIEGAMNEHIVATALYYYDEHNITPSHLAFRQSLDNDEISMSVGQYEYDAMELFLGIENYGSAIQNLGSVLTRPGRLLAFPNTLQHQVQPFQLVDPTRPGHRKILAMFLVDPHIPVLSTANVPPQRKDWWADEVRNVPPFNRLPREIFNMIMLHVTGFPLSWEDAVKARQDLMDERGALVEQINDDMEDDKFFFCEH
ncbi:DUF4246 domain-containing protein [Aspergillus ibericus CBS 121593]|uniref:Uncharacterized protein n=1 Tax=Aspergillus ibericus CBS 121593 TaxID=1448316 RepID=A0A395GJD4_9EURO|nr:hypothetical protein BO80DRAFT_450091 [Aspergillus ibericus CBS 121593]RAK95595.1 hypothetical protein BO80DRAFT_450091 [Aspergillus ibericus CBS 121593]